MEYELPWPYKEGYNYDVEHVRVEIYRLLNQFVAQEKMWSLREEDGWLEHALDIVGQYFDVETQRILIQAATVARVIDDSEAQQFRLHNFDTVCGTLIDKLDDEKEEPLSLREACNKIMHATKYRYDVDENTGLVNPFLYLYGSYKGKKWKATIHVIDFSKHYLNNVIG